MSLIFRDDAYDEPDSFESLGIGQHEEDFGYEDARLKLADEVIDILFAVIEELPCGLSDLITEEEMEKINQYIK